MLGQQEMMEELFDKVAAHIAQDLRGAVSSAVERSINQSLSRILAEGEFHRRLGQELQEGLLGIYRELTQVRRQPGDEAGNTGDLLSEATDQLDQVLKTTERATVEIMEIAERHMDLAAAAGNHLEELRMLPGMADGRAGEIVATLAQGNAALSADLLGIMTTLSFQDLTGQRIARIFEALRRVEALSAELVVSAGIKLQAKAEHPDLDPAEIEAVAQERTSELKGPQSATSQEGIDALLAQMGL